MHQNLVIIPTFNERENIGGLIDRILSSVSADVVIVDDRSPDATSDVVQERIDSHGGRVHLLTRPVREGYGRAVLEGMRFGLERGYDHIITMDGDLSHDPDRLPILLSELQQGADLCIGSRYIPGGRVVNWPVHRLMLSSFANRYVRCITGLPLNDCTSGYRAFRRVVLESIDLGSIRSDGYSFISETNYRAFQQGFKLKESSITFTERRNGVSKMSSAVMLEAVMMPWRLRLSNGWKPTS
jgi:dolichol-phosphate mannosyltransferase